MANSNQLANSAQPTERESLVKLVELAQELILEFRLLNERFEEVHVTEITKKDIENGTDNRF